MVVEPQQAATARGKPVGLHRQVESQWMHLCTNGLRLVIVAIRCLQVVLLIGLPLALHGMSFAREANS
jgi:hypothetical protein